MISSSLQCLCSYPSALFVQRSVVTYVCFHQKFKTREIVHWLELAMIPEGMKWTPPAPSSPVTRLTWLKIKKPNKEVCHSLSASAITNTRIDRSRCLTIDVRRETRVTPFDDSCVRQGSGRRAGIFSHSTLGRLRWNLEPEACLLLKASGEISVEREREGREGSVEGRRYAAFVFCVKFLIRALILRNRSIKFCCSIWCMTFAWGALPWRHLSL